MDFQSFNDSSYSLRIKPFFNPRVIVLNLCFLRDRAYNFKRFYYLLTYPHWVHEDSWGPPEDCAIHHSPTQAQQPLSTNTIQGFLLRSFLGRPLLHIPSGAHVSAILEVFSALVLNTSPIYPHYLSRMREDTLRAYYLWPLQLLVT